ncbi:hypothetical protein M436DRAFT_84874 [Aureobasidium namibiae CBS 147.97]|uniref:BTB domain-containing protein n=1 Tax=Aureobasidium namibiae CBS 147.97 TaxID=1043004 RepID=A0A074X6Q7_9PEZI|nr:uncharacterized protein M436DRAFT_84874 [Aureobasidium namibiae CBS 147.97]KEQ70286.1 hypothetical protein M436DRAFT_84874 [Aureobasidium namibiae CBS 147.97]
MASQLCDPSSVLVKIKEDGTTYIFELPREELCSLSPFFKTAFEGRFLEAQTGIMDMEDVSVELFGDFARWIATDQLQHHTLEDLVNLYVLADKFDIRVLREAITDELTTECFKPDFDVPDWKVIWFMMENIPKCYPIHSLLATAVARVLWHEVERLEGLPYGFGVRVKSNLDKPYGLCDECFSQDESHDTSEYCDHFFDQSSDFDPRHYHEVVPDNRG